MKPLIVGEAPGKNGDATKPIEGRIGARLAACCGLTLDEFLSTFDRINLLNEQPQDSGKGTDFNVRAAAKTARVIEKTFVGRPFVLLLGKRAGSAFGLVKPEYFARVVMSGAAVFVVPHPSGINRWWNELNHELEMTAFMRKMMQGIR